MVKKYKLIVPESIPRDTLFKMQKWLFDVLTLGDGKIIDENFRAFKYIPKEWLEKLYPCRECGALRTEAEGGTTFTVCDKCWDKESNKHPMTWDEYMESKFGNKFKRNLNLKEYSNRDMHELYLWTINNERLKHRPKQTSNEYWIENEDKIDVQGRYAQEIFFDGWNAYVKNRGYDDHE